MAQEPGAPDGRLSIGLEATELAGIRSNYSYASNIENRPAARDLEPKPSGYKRIGYELSKFWRSQISIAVPHVACRDHLGMWVPRVFFTLIALHAYAVLEIRMRRHGQ